MNANPLVSIITPSFNQAQFLGQTINSILAQDYPNIEYIIIDGASTDGSLEIIQSYDKQLSCWISEPDDGQAQAINKGLRIAHGDILGWINSDDIISPGAVSRAVSYLTNNPDLDVVYGFAELIDENNQPVKVTRKTLPVFNIVHVIDECAITQPGSFWKRSIMEKIGLLNESLHYVMDYEYWSRMALAGAKFGYIDKPPQAYFRLSPASKTGSSLDRSGHEKLLVLDQLIADPYLSSKLGLPFEIIHQQAKRARSLACLKISQAHARRKGETSQSVIWLQKAIKYYPGITFERYRTVLSIMRDIFLIGIKKRTSKA